MLAMERHDADLIVQTAVRSSEAVLSGRLLRMHGVLPPVRVNCDLTLSVQVISNLLQNAVRNSPADEPIDVSMQLEGESLEIVVADRGPGITGDDLERLFMPLRRQPTAMSAAGSADARMGMGLAIARTFARAQRGDVYYRPREGGGSEFVLKLPRVGS